MPESLQLAGRLIAAEDDGNLLRYRLLTYGEAGNTSKGRVTIDRGTLTLPSDPATLAASNVEHDYRRPVGRCVELQEDASGLVAAVRPLDTTAGRDLRLEAREGVRAGISVEIENVVIRAGRLVAGVLAGMGHVVRPAFPSSLLTAADAGDMPDPEAATEAAAEVDPEAPPADPSFTTVSVDEYTNDDGTTTRTTRTTTETTETITSTDESDEDDEDDQEDTDMTDTTVKGAAAGATGTTIKAAAPAFGLDQLTAALGDMPNLRSTGRLDAALAPVTQAGPFDTVTTPEYVGELWEGRSPVERFAGLVKNAGPLTSYKSMGWRFTRGPEVHPYAGNLADITSTPVTVETEEITAFRLAGGNRLDRVYSDLPDAGFWDSYLRNSVQDYAVKRDALIGYHLGTNALAETYAGPTPSFYNGSKGWALLIRGARVALRKVVPDFAVVGADLWEEMALTPREYALEYLSAQLGLDDSGSLAGFRIIGASDEPVTNIDGSTFDMTGKVLVGTSGSTLMQELPGGPIRVNAEVIDKGGIDHGVFGYMKIWTPTQYNVLVSPAAGQGA